MLATGAVRSLAEARRIIEHSFPVERFEPTRDRSLGSAVSALPGLRGVDLCLKRQPAKRHFCRTSGTTAKRRRSSRSPLELLRYRSNLLGEDLRITNFGGGNTSSKFELADPLTGETRSGDGGEGERRRSALDRHHRVRGAVSRQARGVGSALSRRGARGRDGGLLSAVRVRRKPRGRVDRHGASCVPAVSARRSPASRLGDRAGGERERQGKARRVQPQVRPAHRVGALAAARIRAGADAAQGG